MSSRQRVFVSRMIGLPVFDPLGDKVGRVRDVVVLTAGGGTSARVVGLSVEVPGLRRVFLPITRVTSIAGGQVITTGLLNMRRFAKRAHESLMVAEVFDRVVTLRGSAEPAQVEDVAIDQQRNMDWEVSKIFVRKGIAPGSFSSRLRRRGETVLVDPEDVLNLLGSTQHEQPATLLAAHTAEMKPADIADLLQELPEKRRDELVAELDDDRLADIMEELPEVDQVQVLKSLGEDRAADVLEAMQPDDAADLLLELPNEQQESLLGLMEPEEADDVRRLLAYDEHSAGGLMTSVPVIMPPEATVAEALAHVRRAELHPTTAAAVFVCRPPLETPTGKYLGMVHIQRLLREPPHTQLGGLVDTDIEPLAADVSLPHLTRRLATYNLVSLPVTDENGRLLGAVTVDDVLDHLLPDDWRDHDADPSTDQVLGTTARLRDPSADSTIIEPQAPGGRHG